MSAGMMGMGLWAANAAVDLSAKLFRFVKYNSDEEFDLASTGQRVFGVVTEGAAAGFPATAQYSDVGKIELGATLVAGVSVMSDSLGRAITAVSSPPGSYEAGIILKGGEVGEIVPILLGGGRPAF